MFVVLEGRNKSSYPVHPEPVDQQRAPARGKGVGLEEYARGYNSRPSNWAFLIMYYNLGRGSAVLPVRFPVSSLLRLGFWGVALSGVWLGVCVVRCVAVSAVGMLFRCGWWLWFCFRVVPPCVAFERVVLFFGEGRGGPPCSTFLVKMKNFRRS